MSQIYVYHVLFPDFPAFVLSPDLALSYIPRLINATDLSYHIDGLRPNTEYEFMVRLVKGPRRESTYSMAVRNKTEEKGESWDGGEGWDLAGKFTFSLSRF